MWPHKKYILTISVHFFCEKNISRIIRKPDSHVLEGNLLWHCIFKNVKNTTHSLAHTVTMSIHGNYVIGVFIDSECLGIISSLEALIQNECVFILWVEMCLHTKPGCRSHTCSQLLHFLMVLCTCM